MIRIRLATPEDSEDLQAIQEKSAIGTDLTISPVNAPDFFARTRAYQQCQIFVACDGNDIVGSAACALRTLVVSGKKEKVGYEFQYITAPDYQKRGIAGRLRKQIEVYLKEHGASYSFCLIMENNLPSINLCQRNGFELHRTLAMPIIFVNKPVPVQSGGTIRPATSDDLEAVAELLNETWRDHDFYEQMSGENLDLFINRLSGHAIENLFLLEKEKRIVACLGFWDLSKVMQVTVRSLSMKLYATRLLLSLVRPFRPIPLIPGRGEVLKQYYLIPMGYREPEYLNQLLCHVNNVALSNGARQLLWICERNHPLMGDLGEFWRENFGVHFYVKRLCSDAGFGERPVFVDGIDL